MWLHRHVCKCLPDFVITNMCQWAEDPPSCLPSDVQAGSKFFHAMVAHPPRRGTACEDESRCMAGCSERLPSGACTADLCRQCKAYWIAQLPSSLITGACSEGEAGRSYHTASSVSTAPLVPVNANPLFVCFVTCELILAACAGWRPPQSGGCS